ncbi:hypothetical protein LZ31DRAFT_381516 [Colletotrichum somersetense]|nr:hypothetical protein LZ31DRAFT_381516 [Colletotrichum somersetense]
MNNPLSSTAKCLGTSLPTYPGRLALVFCTFALASWRQTRSPTLLHGDEGSPRLGVACCKAKQTFRRRGRSVCSVLTAPAPGPWMFR